MMSWMSWRTLPAFHEPAGCVHGEGSDLDISVSLVGPASSAPSLTNRRGSRPKEDAEGR